MADALRFNVPKALLKVSTVPVIACDTELTVFIRSTAAPVVDAVTPLFNMVMLLIVDVMALLPPPPKEATHVLRS